MDRDRTITRKGSWRRGRHLCQPEMLFAVPTSTFELLYARRCEAGFFISPAILSAIRVWSALCHHGLHSPEANTTRATSTVSDVVHSVEAISPDAPNFVIGDFNSCRLHSCLPMYEEYVTCTTDLDKNIDLCYGNISDAYKSVCVCVLLLLLLLLGVFCLFVCLFVCFWFCFFNSLLLVHPITMLFNCYPNMSRN